VLTGTAKVDLVRPILIRDLFTHTAGLTYTFLEDSPVCEMYRQAKVMSNPDQSLESVIASVRFSAIFSDAQAEIPLKQFSPCGPSD
jgi:hypothetical protein